MESESGVVLLVDVVNLALLYGSRMWEPAGKVFRGLEIVEASGLCIPKHVEAEALMELDSCDYESLSAGNCPQRFSNQYRHFSLV